MEIKDYLRGIKMGALKPGVNDLYTWCMQNGDYGQKILSEWTGIDENGNQIDIHGISRGNHTKMMWRCQKCKHEWITNINTRTSLKSRGCPKCAKAEQGEKERKTKIVQGINDFYSWCIQHEEYGEQLLQEWTGREENGEHYEVNEISKGSAKRLIWKCYKCGCEWTAPLYTRTKGEQCPKCAIHKRGESNKFNRTVKGIDDLYTWGITHDGYGEILISEWTGIDEHGNNIDINRVSHGSKINMLWRCRKGHEWIASINAMTNGRRRTGCKICEGLVATEENNLYTWCMNNGDQGKRILYEFGDGNNCQRYIDNNGIEHKPEEYTRASGHKVQWTCYKGHKWETTIKARTRNDSMCPYCNTTGTSYPEQFLYWSLKQIYPNAENRCRVLKSPEHPQGIEFGIGIPEPINGYKAVCIEYSPTYWHKDRVEIDILKQNLCKERNIMFIYIREDSYDELEEIWSQDYVCFKMNYSKRREECKKLVEFILKIFGIDNNAINFDTTEKQILSIKNGTNYSNTSFENNYKLLLKE